MWNIKRWARLRSYQRPDPPALLALRRSPEGPQDATIYEQKAEVLGERFFLKAITDTSTIPD